MKIYIESGVFLQVEKLRMLTLRNLFKRISILLANDNDYKFQNKEYKSHIMPLKLPYEVMSDWDKEIDMDELECIIANLIQ